MKLNALFIGVLFAMATTVSAESGRGRFYLGLDVFTVADGGDQWKKDNDASIDSLVNVTGYDSASYKMTTTAGLGGRLGVRFPFSSDENANWGGSVGYVKGPASDTDFTADSTIVGRGIANEKIDTSFIRLLLEVSKSFPIGSGSTRFSIGAGVGAAQGKIEDKTTYAGSFVTSLGAGNESANKTWTGVTWEINPALTFPSGTTLIELGVRMAGFPVLKKSDTWSKFSWNPFGVYGALHF